MKNLFCLLLITISCCCSTTLNAQEEKPAYCDNLPQMYDKGATVASKRSPLPRFATTPTVEYKVQVAILRNTDPGEYPFHEDLVARYRPCEQVWVIESRESFVSRSEAIRMQNKLRELGYRGAYLIEIVGYRMGE